MITDPDDDDGRPYQDYQSVSDMADQVDEECLAYLVSRSVLVSLNGEPCWSREELAELLGMWEREGLRS